LQSLKTVRYFYSQSGNSNLTQLNRLMNNIVLPQVQLEYRGTTVKDYTFVDDKTGVKRSGYTINHSMEAVDDTGALTSYIVKQTPKLEVPCADYKPEYQRGHQYIVKIRAMEVDKNVVRVSASEIFPAGS